MNSDGTIEYGSPEWYKDMVRFRKGTRDLDNRITQQEIAHPRLQRTAPSQPSLGGPPGYSGNIDLAYRQPVDTGDGHATIRSLGIGTGPNKETLVPTVVDGAIVSNEKAIQNYMNKGQHLGNYGTPQEATEAGHNLSEHMNTVQTSKPLPNPQDIDIPERKTTVASDIIDWFRK